MQEVRSPVTLFSYPQSRTVVASPSNIWFGCRTAVGGGVQ